MRIFIIVAALLFTANCYCQELYPAHPIDAGSKFECTTCKIDFNRDPKGSYTFFPYQPYPADRWNGFAFVSLPPSITIKFQANKDQQYYIVLNLFPWRPTREYVITGPNKYRRVETLNTGDQTIGFIYRSPLTGEVSLVFSTNVQDPWMAKGCKIAPVNF